MESRLPNSWTETTLVTIADWGSGGTPKATESKYYGGDIPWLIIGDLNDGEIKTSQKKITELGLQNSSAKWVSINSVLVAMYGSIGKLGIAKIQCTTNQAIAFTQNIYGDIPHKYLYYYLFSIKRYLLDIGKGGTQANISQTVLKEVKIPIAPLPEQKRIVAKLDALMEKIESSRERLEKIPIILKRFRQSILSAAVSGKLTEEWRENKDYNEETNLPSSWDFVLIDRLVRSTKSDIRTGPFGTSLKKSEHQAKGVPVWGIESIGENGLFTSHNKIFVTSQKAKELKSFEVRGGDIIISRSGTVGEICILPDEVPFGLISTNLMKIVLDKSTILPKFFCWLFDGSFIVKDKLNDLCKGSTRIFLTQTILKQINYPLPSIEEQKQIILRVEGLFGFADKIEARYLKAKAQFDKLPQCLLAKAFRGELVAQDPNDEPASELLERILQEKNEKPNISYKKKQLV
ncbi:MAG: restriction endonuclease subunit S [Cyclobacteriaceae bacterium]|nr:restriction endonuclease subunit S [Cyclobacteriaceae bacterium]